MAWLRGKNRSAPNDHELADRDDLAAASTPVATIDVGTDLSADAANVASDDYTERDEWFLALERGFTMKSYRTWTRPPWAL